MNKNNNVDDLNQLNEKPNEITSAEVVFQRCSTPYKIAMMCHPILFDQFNNSSNSIISAFSEGKTVFYPKKKISRKKKLNLFFFGQFGFISAKDILGGGPLSSAKENRDVFVERFKKIKDKNKTVDEIDTDFCFFYPESSLLGDVPVTKFFLSKQPEFRQTDFALSNNNVGLNMINNLMKLPCQINVPLYKYVIENIHSLVEIGILPPLEVANSPNIEKTKRELAQIIEIWHDFHKRFLALNENKKKQKFFLQEKKFF